MSNQPQTRTLYLLMAEFGSPIVELSRCYQHLGYTSADKAHRAAAALELPVPWFRAQESQKSPRLVMVEDLAAFLDRQAAAARAEFNAIRGAA